MDSKKIPTYPTYKGLKKPFVFKGYKGKFIYYAGAGLLLSLVVGAVGTSFNIIIGLGLMVGGIVGTLFLTNHFQKTKGLFNKTKHNDILWVHPNRMKGNKKLKLPSNNHQNK
jgi:hypothetical protein